jgi:hypothetical protein
MQGTPSTKKTKTEGYFLRYLIEQKPDTTGYVMPQPDILQKVAKRSRVALIYHLQIRDKKAYGNWYAKSAEF